MNVIDISSWQVGISLPTLFADNPLGGVIVKATQGTSYINPCYAEWVKWLSDNNKPFGVYHYLDLYGAEAEARHFVNTVKPYIGKAILVIDYEGNTIRKGSVYLKACLDEIYRLVGVKAFVYVSQSFIHSGGFTDIASAGYPLWIAQYADMNPVHGFLDKPWQSGSVAPFTRYVMHQYTSCGRLNGYSGDLDFDLFYGTAGDWSVFAKSDSAPTPAPTPTPTPKPKPADPVVASEVLDGKYGIGSERIAKLREAGYDPDKVQAKINELYGIAAKVKPIVSSNMDYLGSVMSIVRSI